MQADDTEATVDHGVFLDRPYVPFGYDDAVQDPALGVLDGEGVRYARADIDQSRDVCPASHRRAVHRNDHLSDAHSCLLRRTAGRHADDAGRAATAEVETKLEGGVALPRRPIPFHQRARAIAGVGVVAPNRERMQRCRGPFQAGERVTIQRGSRCRICWKRRSGRHLTSAGSALRRRRSLPCVGEETGGNERLIVVVEQRLHAFNHQVGGG